MTAINPHAEAHDADHGGEHEHPPHLAHHFDSPEQQYDSAKIGMWVFLATEILMFGGLFCAYAVYRYNNPDVFRYSEHHLNTWLGATNTIVLLASSLTMALAVRAAQLGQQTYLKLMLAMTLLGGVGFMVIKSIEYGEKFAHGLFPGRYSVYDRTTQEGEQRFLAYLNDDHAGDNHATGPAHGEGGHDDAGVASGVAGVHGGDADTSRNEPGEGIGLNPAPQDDNNPATPVGDGGGDVQEGRRDIDSQAGETGEDQQPGTPADQQPADSADEAVDSGRQAPTQNLEAPAGEDLSWLGPQYIDPNLGTSDAALVRPAFNSPDAASYVARPGGGDAHAGVEYTDLRAQDKQNVKAFFGIYYMMTGLHGVHVLVGMGLIGWILLKSMAGTFGPAYFTPVDLVGLYWHIVDLIWIFLFPLLYLIH